MDVERRKIEISQISHFISAQGAIIRNTRVTKVSNRILNPILLIKTLEVLIKT